MALPGEMTPLAKDAAEVLGLTALGWVAADEHRAGQFFAMAGTNSDEMRARAQDPEYLGFVLDYVLSDEAMLMAFCEAADVPPDRPMRARAGLPGGDLPHWT
ncbi:MAG: DUF3572 domain-containing protein [Pseudomonadota bacterium]